MAVSPSMQQLTGPTSVMAAIDDPMQRAVMGQSAYNRAAMAVTFPLAPGATEYRDTFESAASAPNLQLTTRVTYLFACSVPLASRLMCESYPTLRLGPAAEIAEALIDSLGSGSASPESVMAELERLDNTWRRYEESQPALEELDRAAAGDMMYLTSATGARFKVLRGEVTLPLQSTRYRYPSE